MLLESTVRIERAYPPEDAEARRALVRRIIASPAFARSNRLSEFLKYVYHLAEKGRFDDIHEQNIGSAVFERTRDYDPGVDNIVRSHATRLRHRLKEYFEQEGKNEALILTIPRGSYIPAFEPRPSWPSAVPEHVPGAPLLLEDPAPVDANHPPLRSVSTSTQEASHESQERELASRKTVLRLRTALITAAIAIVFLIGLLVWGNPFIAHAHAEDLVSRNPLWKDLFAGPIAKTVVVSSDSGLVMFQHFTGRPVSLASYINGDYFKHAASEQVPEEVVLKLGTRRYTPAVDLTVLDRITHIVGDRRDRLSFHYARDLRIEDLKQGNAILLGTAESNPWVQLFEPSMNFFFQDDLSHDKAQMVNRHPLPGEMARYDSTPQDPTVTIYGVVAYRPNLQRTGHVLILEGQTMAGTQTAVDFVFDNSYILPFLKRIRKPDGSLPYFEVLLRSSSFGGQDSRIEVIAYRTEEE